MLPDAGLGYVSHMHGKTDILKQKLSELADPVPAALAAGSSGKASEIVSPPLLGCLRPDALAGLALAEGLSLKELEIFALEQGFLPERYRRNLASLSLREQLVLRRSRVLLIGLGGLGGHCLDFLLRLGIGGILAVDGDCFEASNLNRQLLSSTLNSGLSKVAAAREYAARVNPAVDFDGAEEFVEHERMCELMRPLQSDCPLQQARSLQSAQATRLVQAPQLAQPFSLVIDALGGLTHRLQLQEAADKAALPLVTAAIGGWSGYVAAVPPGGVNPARFLGRSDKAEETLGTPAPVVAFAASLQVKLGLEMLLAVTDVPGATGIKGIKDAMDAGSGAERSGAARTIIFDLLTHTVETVRL